MQCKGHGGTSTAEYTAQVLPGRIWAELSTLPDRLDPDKDQNYQTLIPALLLEEIEKFDRQIGEAVIALCKKPKKITEGQARELVQKHSEVLSRAYHGTTLTIALVNRSQEAMWLAGVGDSTVGKCGLIKLLIFDLSPPTHFGYHQLFHARMLTVREVGKDY